LTLATHHLKQTPEGWHRQAGRIQVLIVDDEEAIREYLSRIINSRQIRCLKAADARTALEYLARDRISLILLDIQMPGCDGFSLLKKIKQIDPQCVVIFITGHGDMESAVQSIRMGAFDYLTKPLTIDRVLQSVKEGIKKRAESLRKSQHQKLFERIEEIKKSSFKRFKESGHQLLLNTVTTLVNTLEAKDIHTRGHSVRVANYCILHCNHMGFPSSQAEDIYIGALLHDIGKIGVREKILLKKDPLTEAEYNEFKNHTLLAVKILEPLRELKQVTTLVRYHHERYDGKGYPEGLNGERIPTGSRIIALADSFDGMTSLRPYRRPMPVPKALREIKVNAGTQFDAGLAASFRETIQSNKRGVQRIMKELEFLTDYRRATL